MQDLKLDTNYEKVLIEINHLITFKDLKLVESEEHFQQSLGLMIL